MRSNRMVLILRSILFILILFEISDVSCNQGFLSPFQYWKKAMNKWDRNWFPNSPSQDDNNEIVDYKNKHQSVEHGVKMGVKDDSCDNAKMKLEVDWDMNPINFTCFDDKFKYYSQNNKHPIHTTEFIPHSYSAQHKCMDEVIEYEQIIPTFGTHRPLWAKYGEYVFLPKQRWLHNLEHGAIVMLYHPCADQNEVMLLKKIVKNCLYRHIITPFNLLTSDRPIALVSWGHLLEMSKVSPYVAVEFIREHALEGPEKTSHDGQYDFKLLEHAEIVSDIDDVNICPFIN